MSLPDAETLAVYDAKARDYADLMATDAPCPRLSAFLERMPPRARMLDLGYGTGTMAARIQAAGHDVLALDASRGMAAEAEARYGIKVRIGTFDYIPQLGRFDGIWAHFSLLHAPRADLPRYLSALHAALHPGGTLLIAMKTGTGAGRDSLGRHYTYVTEAELRALLQTAGFRPDNVETGAEEGFDGVVAPWIAITAHA